MKAPSRYVSFEDLFEIPPDNIGPDAHKLWTEMIYNRMHWHGWTSWLEGYSHTDVQKLAEQFFNLHSYVKVMEEHVYTQLPNKVFFFARQVHPTLYVRGAIWSNGAVWEEIDEKLGRNMTLLINELTKNTFNYPLPNLDSDERLIDFKVFMGV